MVENKLCIDVENAKTHLVSMLKGHPVTSTFISRDYMFEDVGDCVGVMTRYHQFVEEEQYDRVKKRLNIWIQVGRVRNVNTDRTIIREAILNSPFNSESE